MRKLVRFFETSRDQWKAKCRSAKVKIKRLSSRGRAMKVSRDRWKKRAQELERELAAERAARQKAEEEARSRPNSSAAITRPSSPAVAMNPRVPQHQYSLDCVFFFLSFLVSAALSLRGASQVLALLCARQPNTFARPSPWTGRLWLLRVGLFKLTRPKELAADWVWIIDHTLQIGTTKCLLILGVRLSNLPTASTCLDHAAVEPLALIPVTHSNRSVVAAQLEATVKVTGVPREIISDHGSDLKGGIELFQAAHPETIAIYDITHQTAALLKRELEPDAIWLAFLEHVLSTRNRLQQTALAAWRPPRLSSQARYMNVAPLVRWGGQALAALDTPSRWANLAFDAATVETQLGWLREYRQPLAEWTVLLELVTTTERLVRQEGLSVELPSKLAQQLPTALLTERVQAVRAELLAFVTQEAAKAQPGERLLGSTEVIESVFGRLKQVERTQAKNGFTGLILSVGALVAPMTETVVQHALETISTAQVLEW
ncbi:MAG: hypothetical protein ACOYZ8_00280, partial [Chloroflexota bacterium]